MFFYSKQKQKFEFYPKAFQREGRYHGRDPTVIPTRIKFLKLALLNFVILQTLFLCLFAYLYGALFQETSRIHELNFVFVDYDGGVIGTAIRDAYNYSLQAPSFPTMIEKTPEEYANQSALRNAVCQIEYWAALFVSPNASSNYNSALAGGEAARNYNMSNVLSFIWNEARYGTVVDASIAENMLVLSDTAQAALLPIYVADVTRSNTSLNIDLSDTAVAAVVANPWSLKSIDIQPTRQGSRLIYNTLVIVLLLIQDFFYLGTINGLYAQFGMYLRLFPHRIVMYRLGLSAFYTFVGSLVCTGMMWAFRDGWAVNANQFVLSWMVIWLFAHLNFLTLDVFSIWLPLPYIPMALITWVVFNVGSVLLPFQLSNGFYRWAYMIPAHEVFSILIDIWSGGCEPTLRYSLPVLFALEISSMTLSSLGVYRRAHYAVLAEEHKQKEFKERVDAAMATERKHDQRRRKEDDAARRKAELEGVPPASPESTEMGVEEVEDRREFEEAIERADRREEMEDSEMRARATFNPEGIRFPLFDVDGTSSRLSRPRTAG